MMAPELLSESAPASFASDVYAFGMTVYEVVTGKVPFEGIWVYGVPAAVLNGVRPECPESVSGELWELLQACWHQNPAQRLTMDEIVIRLGYIVAQQRRRTVERLVHNWRRRHPPSSYMSLPG